MRIFTIALVVLLILPFVAAHDADYEHLELPVGVTKVFEYQQQLALSVNFLLAFLAGIIGFLSPCGFAVFPAFFAFLFKERKRAVFMTASFTFGLMLSFVSLGIAAGFIGTFFNQFKRQFAVVSGIVLIIFGLMMFFNKGFKFLTFKMDHPKKKHTFLSMTALGFVFALGWTPCVGPILSGVLILAANSGTAISGAMLLFAYSVGVAVPLLLVAYLSDKVDFAKWFQGGHFSFKLFGKTIHTHVYNLISALLLIGLGIVMVYFQGTQKIEEFFVEHTAWNMNWMYGLNDYFLDSGLKSGIAGLIGIAIVFVVLYFVYKTLSKKDEPTEKFK